MPGPVNAQSFSYQADALHFAGYMEIASISVWEQKAAIPRSSLCTAGYAVPPPLLCVADSVCRATLHHTYRKGRLAAAVAHRVWSASRQRAGGLGAGTRAVTRAAAGVSESSAGRIPRRPRGPRGAGSAPRPTCSKYFLPSKSSGKFSIASRGKRQVFNRFRCPGRPRAAPGPRRGRFVPAASFR